MWRLAGRAWVCAWQLVAPLWVLVGLVWRLVPASVWLVVHYMLTGLARPASNRLSVETLKDSLPVSPCMYQGVGQGSAVAEHIHQGRNCHSINSGVGYFSQMWGVSP